MMKSLILISSILLLTTLVLTTTSAIAANDVPELPKPLLDNLAFVGHNSSNFAHIMDIEIVGDRAYALVGMSYGLETYDISNPAQPVRIDSQGTAAWNAKAYNDRLYVFNRQNGFRIYDISGSKPLELGQYNPADPNTLYECGVLQGTQLFVAAHQRGIYAFEVGNPGNPLLVDDISLTTNHCWDVEVTGSYLLVANGRFGLSVVALGLPPVQVATLPLPGLANHILLDGQIAVITLGGDGLATVDVSDPTNPVLLDIAPSLGNAFGSGIWNSLVAVGSWRYLELFDVSDPSNIRRKGFDNTKTWAMGADIEPNGNTGLVAVGDWRGMSTYTTSADDGPDIDVTPEYLDFGEVPGYEEAGVTVRNTGSSLLQVNVVNTPNEITVSPASFTVDPGAVRQVTVRATGLGSVKDTIRYLSNDGDEPTVTQFVYKNSTSFPQLGSQAPEFALEDGNGYWHYLSDYRGKVVLLEFGGLW